MDGSPKKICIITEKHWAKVMGGSQYQIKCLIDRIVLNRENFEVYYLARYLKKGFKEDNYEIREISKPNCISQYGYFFDANKLLKILKGIKPDVIYQRVFGAYTGIAAYYATSNRCNCIAHISSDYDLIPYSSRFFSKSFLPQMIDRAIGKYGLKKMKYIVTQSEQQSNFLKLRYRRSDAIMIPNFHPTLDQTLKKEKKPIKVIWVSNFKSLKRPEIFFRLAVDMEEEKNVKFIMIGRFNPHYEALKDKIQKQKNLSYLGELSIEEVNKVLSESHIFVNTSRAEGFPNTFIQSWMNEVPVVSLDVNTDGVFDNQKIGIYCNSYENLIKAVKLLVHNSDLRTKMGVDARLHAIKKHSMKNADKLIDLFHSS
ncbi:glycosyltransferase family 1 protein [candidate division WS5 bacterium]|uniref:Glycosyltransferase family 1 protein n=1 Tax=candidate division WS5 bacterium TaxID=2093353 RepID=A0A419DAT7_9BACT|nr:MAG: glycosyltransferase family 1 protein [candidate division WS5 bacterium]